MIVEVAKRFLHNAMCVVIKLIKDIFVVYGGDTAEISCLLAVSKYAEKVSGVDQCTIRVFSDALDDIPRVGLEPIKRTVSC